MEPQIGNRLPLILGALLAAAGLEALERLRTSMHYKRGLVRIRTERWARRHGW